MDAEVHSTLLKLSHDLTIIGNRLVYQLFYRMLTVALFMLVIDVNPAVYLAEDQHHYIFLPQLADDFE